jgi:predicted nucleic acid-binding Zn ribbon protein
MQKHSDPLDTATDLAEEFTQQAIDNILRQGGEPVLPFKSSCYNCLDTLEAPKRFCDEECANEYTYVQQRAKANRVTK